MQMGDNLCVNNKRLRNRCRRPPATSSVGSTTWPARSDQVPVSAGHDLRARSSGSTTAGRASAARPASPAHEPREPELRHLPLRSGLALRPARPTPRSIGGHLGGAACAGYRGLDGRLHRGLRGANGGAGALILEHGESRTAQLTAPAGRLCSRTQADLTAIEIALRRPQAGLGDDDRPTVHVTRRSALISVHKCTFSYLFTRSWMFLMCGYVFFTSFTKRFDCVRFDCILYS